MQINIGAAGGYQWRKLNRLKWRKLYPWHLKSMQHVAWRHHGQYQRSISQACKRKWRAASGVAHQRRSRNQRAMALQRAINGSASKIGGNLVVGVKAHLA
jgi:hypothetical protein